MTGVVIKRGSVVAETDTHRGKTMWRYAGHVAGVMWLQDKNPRGMPPTIREEARKASPQKPSEGDLISDPWPPEPRKNEFCCLKLSSFWDFVTAVPRN